MDIFITENSFLIDQIHIIWTFLSLKIVSLLIRLIFFGHLYHWKSIIIAEINILWTFVSMKKKLFRHHYQWGKNYLQSLKKSFGHSCHWTLKANIVIFSKIELYSIYGEKIAIVLRLKCEKINLKDNFFIFYFLFKLRKIFFFFCKNYSVENSNEKLYFITFRFLMKKKNIRKGQDEVIAHRHFWVDEFPNISFPNFEEAQTKEFFFRFFHFYKISHRPTLINDYVSVDWWMCKNRAFKD